MSKRHRLPWLAMLAAALAPISVLVVVLAAPTPALAAATAVAPAAVEPVPRHPLELKALVDPKAVLAELPVALAAAKASGNQRELALLWLARANACRVIADWSCQRDAGREAAAAAKAAGEPILRVRGLIAESRGSVSLQDYSRGEHLLGEAELLLERHPSPELSADVFLAYSSLSALLGKNGLAADYARRGLAQLGAGVAEPMQVRLLRNLARAQAELGQDAQASESLGRAHLLMAHFDDPKLGAELYLETARLAHKTRDVATQKESGGHILRMAGRLANSQLSGLGHEVLGIAALDAGDGPDAERELAQSLAAFRQLGSDRDELRVTRLLLETLVARDASKDEVRPHVRRLLVLDEKIERDERAKASEDFDARLKYAASEVELVRLKDQALLAQERARSLQRTSRLSLALTIVSVVGGLVLAAFFLLQRRSNRRLREALARERESEARYRMLADNSRDLVVRMRADGHRLYVSPSAREMLGWDPAELAEPRWELVHPDDREPLRTALSDLMAQGGIARVSFRVAHKEGHYVWIEALARRVESAEGAQKEIVYSGRDITARVEVEQALAAQQKFVQTITDRVPAMIAYVDAEQRYQFANALYERQFGISRRDMIGRTMLETWGEEVHARIRPHVELALSGKLASFEGYSEIGGKPLYHQTEYVPDIDDHGKVLGFFALTLDITRLKQVELELARQARFDSLTGIANRRYLEERMAVALGRSKRHHTPIILLYLDIDHFKQINDSLGHAVGDGVIREFALRLKSCVREEDLIARLGGDEFVVLVDDAVSPDIGELIARKLIQAMRAPIVVEGHTIEASCSIGIAFYWDTPKAEDLLAAADEALYAAKAAGRNTFRLLERD